MISYFIERKQKVMEGNSKSSLVWLPAFSTKLQCKQVVSTPPSTCLKMWRQAGPRWCIWLLISGISLQRWWRSANCSRDVWKLWPIMGWLWEDCFERLWRISRAIRVWAVNLGPLTSMCNPSLNSTVKL